MVKSHILAPETAYQIQQLLSLSAFLCALLPGSTVSQSTVHFLYMQSSSQCLHPHRGTWRLQSLCMHVWAPDAMQAPVLLMHSFRLAHAPSEAMHSAPPVQEVQPGETTLKVSLRSCDGFDTTPITTAFGGGGHAAAGSCMMTEEQFQAWR